MGVPGKTRSLCVFCVFVRLWWATLEIRFGDSCFGACSSDPGRCSIRRHPLSFGSSKWERLVGLSHRSSQLASPPSSLCSSPTPALNAASFLLLRPLLGGSLRVFQRGPKLSSPTRARPWQTARKSSRETSESRLKRPPQSWRDAIRS